MESLSKRLPSGPCMGSRVYPADLVSHKLLILMLNIQCTLCFATPSKLCEVAEAVLDIAQNKTSQLAHTDTYYMHERCCAICFA